MCFNPIKLKSGEVVPCGKCEECYSQRRNEWSVRLQLHTLSYDAMPLFVTLTYAPAHLPECGLKKSDLQDFIKRIRDKYSLYNTDFSYFGCGEYGDKDLFTGRAHYHILLFGMDWYESLYNRDDLLCQCEIEKDWKLGECFVCRAEWSGIHYVTKYVLKYFAKDWDSNQCPPFTLCSKGIGSGFINTPEYRYIKRRVNVAEYRKVLEDCPQIDFTNAHTIFATTNILIDKLTPFVEYARVILPSGKQVPLPRYFRKKLFGSYQHWTDNPFAYFRYCQKMNRYANDVINGFNGNDRVLVAKQRFLQKLINKGHLVKPSKRYSIK